MREVTAYIEIEVTVKIDDHNKIVKEYEDDKSLIVECQGYKWSKVLPVIEDKGIELKNTDIMNIDIY